MMTNVWVRVLGRYVLCDCFITHMACTFSQAAARYTYGHTLFVAQCLHSGGKECLYL